MVFSEFILLFPGGFFLGVMIPLDFAKLDGFGTGDSFCGLQYLDGFLFVGSGQKHQCRSAPGLFSPSQGERERLPGGAVRHAGVSGSCAGSRGH